jgi:formylglycine-generating enzyme
MFIQDNITQNFRLFIGNEVIEMVYVKGGNYQMERAQSNPLIYLSDFWIGKYLVIQSLYEAVMKENPAHFKDSHKPVEQVNWADCKQFIAKLNTFAEVKAQKISFRLPTETEWEYTASNAGISNEEYAGSNVLEEVGWYDENSPNQSQQIALKKPNQLGIYDMTGNLWEWCEDDYDNEAYQKAKQGMNNPVCINGEVLSLDNELIHQNEQNGISKNKVNRGGSWRDGVRCCRLVNRDTYTANLRLDIIGFRLVGVFL